MLEIIDGDRDERQIKNDGYTDHKRKKWVRKKKYLESHELHLHHLQLNSLLSSLQLRLRLPRINVIKRTTDSSRHGHILARERSHCRSCSLGNLCGLANTACTEASEKRCAIVGRHCWAEYACCCYWGCVI